MTHKGKTNNIFVGCIQTQNVQTAHKLCRCSADWCLFEGTEPMTEMFLSDDDGDDDGDGIQMLLLCSRSRHDASKWYSVFRSPKFGGTGARSPEVAGNGQP